MLPAFVGLHPNNLLTSGGLADCQRFDFPKQLVQREGYIRRLLARDSANERKERKGSIGFGLKASHSHKQIASF